MRKSTMHGEMTMLHNRDGSVTITHQPKRAVMGMDSYGQFYDPQAKYDIAGSVVGFYDLPYSLESDLVNNRDVFDYSIPGSPSGPIVPYGTNGTGTGPVDTAAADMGCDQFGRDMLEKTTFGLDAYGFFHDGDRTQLTGPIVSVYDSDLEGIHQSPIWENQ